MPTIISRKLFQYTNPAYHRAGPVSYLICWFHLLAFSWFQRFWSEICRIISLMAEPTVSFQFRLPLFLLRPGMLCREYMMSNIFMDKDTPIVMAAAGLTTIVKQRLATLCVYPSFRLKAYWYGTDVSQYCHIYQFSLYNFVAMRNVSLVNVGLFQRRVDLHLSRYPFPSPYYRMTSKEAVAYQKEAKPERE